MRIPEVNFTGFFFHKRTLTAVRKPVAQRSAKHSTAVLLIADNMGNGKEPPRVCLRFSFVGDIVGFVILHISLSRR